MTLDLVDEGGVKVIEGVAGERVMANAEDVSRVIEACISGRTRFALLYPENLPPAFFDLSSGDAGTVLQKLRTYRVRLALVGTPGSFRASSRFGELVAEEQRGPNFRVFETRDAAREWLAQP